MNGTRTGAGMTYLALLLLAVSVLSDETNIARNKYGQVLADVNVAITDDKVELFKVFDVVSPQYQAERFCLQHNIQPTECESIVNISKEIYSGVNFIGAVRIRLGKQSEVNLNLFDTISPERYRTLFCANYFIDTSDCDSLVATATRIIAATNLIGTVPINLNNTWEVELKVVDTLPVNAQAKVFCDRYFLPPPSCEVVTSTIQKMYDNASLIGVLPLVIGEGTAVTLKVYDSDKPSKQAAGLCTRYFLSKDSCDLVEVAATDLFYSAHLLGLLPVAMGEVTLHLRIYDSVRPEDQAGTFCKQHLLMDEACHMVTAAAVDLFQSANLVSVVPVAIDGQAWEMKLYDTLDSQTQALSFCARHNLPHSSTPCDLVVEKAMQVFAVSTVAGSLPVATEGRAGVFTVYNSYNVQSQVDSFCSRNMLSSTSCKSLSDAIVVV